jgi:hypothetical protein
LGRAKTVEINGRKYDAATGKLIKTASAQPITGQRGGSIDGFSRAKPANQLHSRTAKSQTLDRKAVSSTKTQVVSKSVATPKAIHRKDQAKSQAHKVDSGRQNRAKVVSKSGLISKFGSSKSSAQVDATANKSLAESEIAPAQPSPFEKQIDHYSPNESNKEKGKKPKKKSTRRFMAFNFNRPKAKSIFAGTALVLLVAGYITYLNIPNLSLKVAASRAGINATMPGYKPSGFAMSGPINYSQGLVTLNFQSNSDERSFAIAERASSWDSESLLANYVEQETPNYVTFQEKGLTIYVYDGSNATWVDGGIWYTIEGESQLNSDQLLKIASSM